MAGASKRKRSTPGVLYARLSGIVLSGDREVPTEFRIFKAGENPSEKGLFIFDEKSALSVMEEYAAHNKPMLFDYNHGTTLGAEATPEQSLAAGQFVPEVRNGELWAKDIKWTDRARSFLAAGEYRLFSPYFTHDKEGRVERLINVALTNLPALDGIPALVAANANPDNEDHMSECASCSALNAKLSAQTEELSALKSKLSFFEKEKDEEKTKATALTATVTSLTAITGQASQAAALGVVEGWKIKAEGHDKLAAEKAQLEATTLKAELTAILSAGSKEGKVDGPLHAELEATALALGGGKLTREGVDRVAATVKTLGKKVVTADDAAKPPADGGAAALSADLKHTALLAGVSEASVIAAQKKIAERAAARAAGG
jgi:phage I-like protein